MTVMIFLIEEAKCQFFYSKYRFVVIFLPLMNFVEVDTDLKLPIPPPPPPPPGPPKDDEEKDVKPPPPMSPNELKPTKKRNVFKRSMG